ncbi:MAG: helix-turn-helix domain-containing protein [Phenylobacterium sp.]
MPDSIDLHLGKRLRHERRLRGWTQTSLGAAVGLRFQQIQKYECADNRMSAAMLWRLARALEVEVQQFFEGFVERRPSGVEAPYFSGADGDGGRSSGGDMAQAAASH